MLVVINSSFLSFVTLPLIEILLPSVPQDVKNTFSDLTFNKFAIVFLESVTSFSALIPKSYKLEGLPKSTVIALTISFTAFSDTFVVAALSKYIIISLHFYLKSY